MDPNNGSVLAMANWPRIDANDLSQHARLGAPEPRRRLHLRARLDVQGVHRRRRAPGGRRRARHAASTCRRRSRSPTASIGESHAAAGSTLDTARDPRPVQQRRRDQDRPAAARRALRPVGAALRLRQADRRRAARRGAGRRRSRSRSTRARRWATCRSARASSSRRSRWRRPTRRSPTAASCATPHVVADVGGKPAAEPPGPPHHLRAAPPTRCARCSKGVFAPGGTASEVSLPGYELAGKTGTANKIDTAHRRVLRGELRRLVRRLRARRQAEAADLGDGRRAARRDLRRRGRRAGVRQDRRVRAARTCGSRRPT